jgi:hypothetical protein
MSTQATTRTITTRRADHTSSTVPPVWASHDEPVDYSTPRNDTVPRPIFNHNSSVSNNSVNFETNINMPPPLMEVQDHPDLNRTLCQRYNDTVKAVDWKNNHGYDQAAGDCEEELLDVLTNIPEEDIEAGVEYITVHDVFFFMTGHPVGRLILAGVSCFISAATWRLLVLAATHLPLPQQHKVSLLRALDWPRKFTASLLRSTSAVARGVLIGRRRSVSGGPTELVAPIRQADAGLIVRGVSQPSSTEKSLVSPGRDLQSPRVGAPYLRRSSEAALEPKGEWADRNLAQSPLPVRILKILVRGKRMGLKIKIIVKDLRLPRMLWLKYEVLFLVLSSLYQSYLIIKNLLFFQVMPAHQSRSLDGDQSVLRSAGSMSELPPQVSPMGFRGCASLMDASTPIRHPQEGRHDAGLLPPPYYPPSPWFPPYHPYVPQYPYPYYPSSPASLTSTREVETNRLPEAATAPTCGTSVSTGQRRMGVNPRNLLLESPIGSQSSVSTREGNDVSLVLDGSVNLSSPRWDLSPVVIEAVSVSGGVNNDSIRAYLNRSATNFQELVRGNPEPGVLEEALAGSSLEMQVRIFLFLCNCCFIKFLLMGQKGINRNLIVMQKGRLVQGRMI